MTLLILGLLIFFGIHLLPSFAGPHRRLVERMGTGPYKGAFSLIALAGFVLLAWGKARAGFVPVWTPPTWSRHLALTFMPISFMLLAASLLPSNARRVTPHPMLWGVTLWAVLHLLANGDLASILLFGSFGAYALYGIRALDARGAKPSTKAYPVVRDLAVVGAGLIAYVVLLFLHPYLFGVPALG